MRENPADADRPQVRVGAEQLPEFEERPLGALGGGQPVVPGVADGPQQDGRRLEAGGAGRRRKRLAAAVPGGPGEVVALHLEPVSEALGHPFENALGLGDDVGTDPVTRETDEPEVHGGAGS